jgi:DNA-binding NtrC family response regulator
MPPTVLAMDDDALALESLKGYLEGAECVVVTASSAREALDQARKVHCDVALLDMKMPDLDGFQVAAMLRQLQPAMQVIMFTGYASLESEARAAQLGFYEFLPKSNWYDLLLPTIERVLTEPERPLPSQRPVDLEQAAVQYVDEGKWELAALAFEQAARIAEFTHDWKRAATLYGQAFEHMHRAQGLSAEACRIRELAECAQRIGAEPAGASA